MKEVKVELRNLISGKDWESKFYEDEKLSTIIKWARNFIPEGNVILLDIYPEKN